MAFAPAVVKRITLAINLILVILGVLAIISLPFLWFGVIAELATQNR